MTTMKKKTGKIMQCQHCNKEVYVPKNRFDTFKYCSRKCLALGSRVQIEKDCEVCGKRFSHISSRSNTAKYCSRSCYYKAQHLKGSIVKKCKHCDTEFRCSPSENRVYCSRKCVGKENKKTFKPNYTTVRKAMLNRNMITECARCGYNEHPTILGVHHKDRNRDNNDITNLEVLCPNCHSLEHNKHICQHN